MKYLLIVCAISLTACNWAKNKAKETVNKTGEVVAKTGSEFADGVYKGIEKTFQNQLVVSPELTRKGFKTGKITFHGTDSTNDNILTAYLIFEDDFDNTVTVKVFSEEGQEYGRTSQILTAKKGFAGYFDFVFDKRTNIDGKGKITFE